MEFVEKCVENSGGDLGNLMSFAKPTPENLKYSTLITAKQNGHQLSGLIDAIYEWQLQPLIYLVDGSKPHVSQKIRELRRLVAMRGDTPYLGIAQPDNLDIFSIGLDNKSTKDARLPLNIQGLDEKFLIAKLGNVRPASFVNKQPWISSVILRLLTSSINKIIEHENFSTKEDAISLVGRTLFARFLADRSMIPSAVKSSLDAGELFDTPETAAQTSEWLDDTFNGDFLPLPNKIFTRLSSNSLHELGNVMRKSPNDQLYLGWEDKWDYLDFAHIPVGILSQVYEMFLRDHYPTQQRNLGGYYTPSSLANFMVAATVRGATREFNCQKPRVLDPACGAGVFLISAFRELVSERWLQDGKRPSTTVLRSILNNQITGFDIDESALRFAALGLYLMSIELDANTEPTKILKFSNLRGKVLYKFSDENKNSYNELGSLGNKVGKEHDNAYDIVIGNPPWSSRTKIKKWQVVEDSIKKLVGDLAVNCLGNLVPNRALDIAFLWKSKQWAKSGGQIALVLNARLLFKQGHGMPLVREMLFDDLDIKSIINGSELARTKFFQNTEAPFCVIFAKNKVAKPGSGFQLVNPRREQILNDSEFLRLDYNNADIIRPILYKQFPNVFKSISLGSQDDLAIFARMHSMNFTTLGSFWENSLELKGSKVQLQSGVGFKKGRGKSNLSKDQLKKFQELSVLQDDGAYTIINCSNNYQVDLNSIGYIGNFNIYQAPLLVVHQSPPVKLKCLRVGISNKPIIYSSSYFGYSAKGHPKGIQLLKFLCIILSSKIAMWQALITGGKFGIERKSIEKIELDNFIIPDFNVLSNAQLSESDNFYEKLASNNYSESDINQWVAEIYGLDKTDFQIISDTLEFRLPYNENQKNAQLIPSKADVLNFCRMLESEMVLDLTSKSRSVRVREFKKYSVEPWTCLWVNFNDGFSQKDIELSKKIENQFISYANNVTTTPFLIPIDETNLLIGILNHKRNFCFKEARKLSLKIAGASHVKVA